MSTRRKRADTVTTKAPPPKRKRDSDSESESSPDSDSELSDLGEEDLEEPIDFQQARKANESDDDDDEDEDEEEDFDESSDEDDTPEEAEDSYVFEEDKDVSEEEPPKKGTGKALLKEPVSRASNRRKSTYPAPTHRRKPNTSAPGSSLRESITASSRNRNNQKAAPQPRGKAGGKATEEKPFKLTLKVGKDKLREATSNWTPPPAAADSGPGTTAAATPESSASVTSDGIPPPRAPTMTLPTRAGRGRKIVEEETSSSSSEEEEEDEDEDAEGEDEDAEGEEVDIEEDAEGVLEDDGLNDEDAEGETDDEELIDSDDATNNNTGVNSPDFRSRTGTPDLSKLTRRQRGRFDELYSADLLELPTGIERPSAAKIVPLTADEAALKRAEMARRRKNLTDQRLEEEKMDTINKLLKKQTPKMRKGRGTGDATPAGGPYADSTMGGISDIPAPPPTMVRWVSNASGIRLGVPEAWMGGPAGAVFEKQIAPEVIGRRKMVEVFDDPMDIDMKA